MSKCLPTLTKAAVLRVWWPFTTCLVRIASKFTSCKGMGTLAGTSYSCSQLKAYLLCRITLTAIVPKIMVKGFDADFLAIFLNSRKYFKYHNLTYTFCNPNIFLNNVGTACQQVQQKLHWVRDKMQASLLLFTLKGFIFLLSQNSVKMKLHDLLKLYF